MPCSVLYFKFQFLGVVITETVLEEVFNRFGPLEKVQIIQNPLTEGSMGYAFVYYKSVQDAKTAKGQIKSEWIYEVIDFPNYQLENPLSFDEKIKSFAIISIVKSSETDLWGPQNTVNVKNSKGEHKLGTYI